MGGRVMKKSLHSKHAKGCMMPWPNGLVVPAGLDRAVEAILGERVRGWFVDSPQAASDAIAFLKGKDLGRGTFIPQVPRWNVIGPIESVVVGYGGSVRRHRSCGRS